MAQQEFKVVRRMRHTRFRLEAFARQSVVITQHNQVRALWQSPIPGQDGCMTNILIVYEQAGIGSRTTRWYKVGAAKKRDNVACPLDGGPKVAYLRACSGDNNGYWLSSHNTDILLLSLCSNVLKGTPCSLPKFPVSFCTAFSGEDLTHNPCAS